MFKDQNFYMYLGDCIEGLLDYEGPPIHLFIIDPDYFLKNTQIFFFESRKNFSTKFDVADSRYKTSTEYLDFIDKLMYRISIIADPNASIYFFCGVEYISDIIKIVKRYSFNWKTVITWHKTDPMYQIRKRNYISSTEYIVYFAQGKFTFNYGKHSKMHNHITIEGPHCKGIERGSHPNQKPEYLIEHLIEVSSNEGDIVCSPFLGSGVDIAVALKMNRKGIGWEIREKYYKEAKEKIEKLIEAYGQKSKSAVFPYGGALEL